MKKKTIYWVIAIIVVLVIIIVLSSPKTETVSEEVTPETGEVITPEGEVGEEVVLETKEKGIPDDIEEVSSAKVDLIMEISKDGFKPDKFKVTKGITFNWHLINTNEDTSYGVIFDDPFFGDGPIMGVGKGKGKESVRAFVVPSEIGEYSFYEISNPKLKGIMYVE